MSSDALVYALAALSSGVRQILGDELRETPRDELVNVLATTFRGPEELKAALEEAFERSLQGLVIGLKQAWLLMETGGEHDYCEAFGERVRAGFVAEQGIEGRLFIDFLDGFFLDFDTAADSAPAVLGLNDGDPDDGAARLFGALLEAGVGGEAADQVAARATEAVRRAFIEVAGLEEEHPLVRLGCWRDLLADGLHYHFTEAARTHPTWSRYLEQFSPEGLDREEMRAICGATRRLSSGWRSCAGWRRGAPAIRSGSATSSPTATGCSTSPTGSRRRRRTSSPTCSRAGPSPPRTCPRS